MKKSTGDFHVYSGTGSPIHMRDLKLPPAPDFLARENPEDYLAEKGLRDAVNVAIALGQPLLITGEPGTGKTRLAWSICHELGLGIPLVFHTKSTSTARDLFYSYDALGHFHDAHLPGGDPDPGKYIHYQALGLAILLSLDPEEAAPHLPPKWRGRGSTRSVVLVDEVDKAPRDLPNDVLNEIENAEFEVRETKRLFRANPRLSPIVIFTSNSEKNLPDPFLRRCVFYHIPFPDQARLNAIVLKRLKLNPDFSPKMAEAAAASFMEIRKLEMRKKPATAEFLAWVRVLERFAIDLSNPKPEDLEVLLTSYSLLAKTREDLELLKKETGKKFATP